MDLFDKQYVHCFYDVSLEGKQGFFSDNLNCLRSYVNNVNTQMIRTVTESKDFSYPFVCINEGDDNENSIFRYFYYDPFYDLKVKQQEGHVIQMYDDRSGQWIDCNPNWVANSKYRVKPSTDRLCTNEELMRWLAQGNGMVRTITAVTEFGFAHTTMAVNTSELGLDVADKMVRRWDDDDWHIPMISYLGNIKGEDNE